MVLALGAGACVLLLLWPHHIHESDNHPPSFSEPENSLNVLFVGDIMLDRAVAQYARIQGDQRLFAGVKELFASADILVGNLEGSITTYSSVSEENPKILRFTFNPRFAALLREVGFDAVSLANNHTLDFGVDGYEQTKDFLQGVKISSFGHPFNTKNLSTKLQVGSKTLCLIGYHSLFDPSSTWIEAEIRSVRPSCSYVVVMAHWGEEYQHEPTSHQKHMAHTFIDLGVDVIVGAHPHIVQPVEIYKNRAIFYSLGNFLFDQAFQPEVRRGVAVRVTFGSSTTAFTLTPVDTFKEVTLLDASTTAAVLDELRVERLTFELVR